VNLNGWLESYCRHELIEPEMVSLLYRILHEGQVQRPPSRDKILCLDTPGHIRCMRLAMRRLPDNQRICIWMRFSYPIKETGQMYTKAEIATFLGLSPRGFRRHILAGKKRIRRELPLIAA